MGQQVHVVLGASDLQRTPVNLYFRWRTVDGTPVASPPRGWSCERRRLAAGATVSDCTFAPPKDYTAVRFLDLSATNYVTGAQSDTRSYRLEAKPAPRGTGGEGRRSAGRVQTEPVTKPPPRTRSFHSLSRSHGWPVSFTTLGSAVAASLLSPWWWVVTAAIVLLAAYLLRDRKQMEQRLDDLREH